LGRNARHDLPRANKLTLARGLVALIAREMSQRGSGRQRDTALA